MLSLWFLASTFAVALSETTVLSWNTSCPQYVNLKGVRWPTRYYPNCVIGPWQNNGTVQDINIVTAIPQPDWWPAMVMAEPLVAAVAQEVEDLQYLPGYRLKFRLVDNLCTPQEAVAQLTRELSQPPVKHGYISGDCSSCCMSENDALQYYNILQVSPQCTLDNLSDRTRYPYFLRHMASTRFVYDAVFPLLRTLKWWRFSLVSDAGVSTIRQAVAQRFRDTVSQPGSDGWMLVKDLQLNAQNAAAAVAQNASLLAQQLALSDSRIVILLIYSTDASSVLYCETLPNFLGWAGPRIVWVSPMGNPPDFSVVGLNTVNTALAAGGRPTCTQDMLLQASFGWIQFNWAPMRDSTAIHGLSGRRLIDIKTSYYQACNAFDNGGGTACYNLAGYYYDSAWEWAWLLRKFLIEAGQPLDQIRTAAGRSFLYQTGLTADFMGATGRVRHFNSVSPTTSPPSHGDRLGDISVYQLQGIGQMPLVATLQNDGSTGVFVMTADLLWSATDPSKRTRCNGTCDLNNSYVPPCWNSTCAPGYIYSLQKGCTPCPSGMAAAAAEAQCKTCPVGTFATAGQGSCTLCPQGKYQPEMGSSSCLDCEPGRAALPGASGCTDCPAGKFKVAAGPGACVGCPGSFTTQGTGAVSPRDCGCWAGTFLEADNTTCVPCSQGMQCKDFNMRRPQQSSGFYVESQTPYKVWRCDGESQCPGGPAGTCGANRLPEPGCTHCGPGYFSSSKAHECVPCDNGSIAGLGVGLVLAALLVLLSFHTATNFPVLQTSASSVIGSTVVSMAVTALLVLKSFGTTATLFPQPLQGFFASLDLVVLRLDMFQVSCFTRSTSYWSTYIVELLVLPVCFFLLALAMGLASCLPTMRKRLFLNIPSYINSCGSLFSTFFISIAVMSFEPFRCEVQPTGQAALAVDRSILCWESNEHQALVALGVVAILLYPVFYISLGGLFVLSKERLVLRWGQSAISASRFLRGGFKPEKTGFSLWLSLRHLLVALLPVIVRGPQGLQVQLLFLVVLLWHVAVQLKRPWRYSVLERADLVSTLFFGFVLLQLALLPPLSPTNSDALAWFLFLECSVMLAALAAAGLAQLVLSRASRKSYHLFLSHHKIGCGLFCRQLKLMIEAKSSAKVFLDVDNLSNLDQIEQVVRGSLENLVILVTREVFHRFWCAVEIVNAVKNRVPIVLVIVDPSAAQEINLTEGPAFVTSLMQHWTQASAAEFQQQDISPGDLEMAFNHITSAPRVHLPMIGQSELQAAGLKELLQLTHCPKWRKTGSRSMSTSKFNKDAVVGVAAACDPLDSTQLCIARILGLLLLEQGVHCEVIGQMEGSKDPTPTMSRQGVAASALLSSKGEGSKDPLPIMSRQGVVAAALVSSTFHRSPTAVAAAAAAVQAGRPLMALVTAEYSQPDAMWWVQLQNGQAFSESDKEEMRKICPSITDELITKTLKQVYGTLALPFNPALSEDVMVAEFARIFKRMCTLAEVDQPKGVARSISGISKFSQEGSTELASTTSGISKDSPEGSKTVEQNNAEGVFSM